MQLQLILPTDIIVDRKVKKIIAEGEQGYFCLLPRHIDFVSALAPGIFYFVDGEDAEFYYAINQGILVKAGDLVRVSTVNAISSGNLDELREVVSEKFLDLDEHERSARTALTRLELGTLRRFMELKEQLRG